MAVKKIKTDQEAEAPETSAAASQAGQESSTEDEKDKNPSQGVEDGEDIGQDVESGEGVPGKPPSKVLTALRPILYLARQYKIGDSLPVNNTEMAEAWIAAGSAEWKEKKGGRVFP